MNLLLVDDNKVSIDILAQYIKPDLPNIHEIIVAYDGLQGLDIIYGSRPDIIVTDIKMPHLDGIEMIRRIQKIEDYEPYIFIISSYNDFQYVRDALHLHVVDYILKPVDHEELIEKLKIIQKDPEHDESKSMDVFEELQLYISGHLSESLTLNDISTHLHYNAAYLGRLIKKNTGCTYNDYLLRLRVIKAKSLLVNTKDTIKIISKMVGFRDPEHFTKRFRKIEGMTPSQYRRKQK